MMYLLHHLQINLETSLSEFASVFKMPARFWFPYTSMLFCILYLKKQNLRNRDLYAGRTEELKT